MSQYDKILNSFKNDYTADDTVYLQEINDKIAELSTTLRNKELELKTSLEDSNTALWSNEFDKSEAYREEIDSILEEPESIELLRKEILELKDTLSKLDRYKNKFTVMPTVAIDNEAFKHDDIDASYGVIKLRETNMHALAVDSKITGRIDQSLRDEFGTAPIETTIGDKDYKFRDMSETDGGRVWQKIIYEGTPNEKKITFIETYTGVYVLAGSYNKFGACGFVDSNELVQNTTKIIDKLTPLYSKNWEIDVFADGINPDNINETLKINKIHYKRDFRSIVFECYYNKDEDFFYDNYGNKALKLNKAKYICLGLNDNSVLFPNNDNIINSFLEESEFVDFMVTSGRDPDYLSNCLNDMTSQKQLTKPIYLNRMLPESYFRDHIHKSSIKTYENAYIINSGFYDTLDVTEHFTGKYNNSFEENYLKDTERDRCGYFQIFINENGGENRDLNLNKSVAKLLTGKFFYGSLTSFLRISEKIGESSFTNENDRGYYFDEDATNPTHNIKLEYYLDAIYTNANIDSAADCEKLIAKFYNETVDNGDNLENGICNYSGQFLESHYHGENDDMLVRFYTSMGTHKTSHIVNKTDSQTLTSSVSYIDARNSANLSTFFDINPNIENSEKDGITIGKITRTQQYTGISNSCELNALSLSYRGVDRILTPIVDKRNTDNSVLTERFVKYLKTYDSDYVNSISDIEALDYDVKNGDTEFYFIGEVYELGVAAIESRVPNTYLSFLDNNYKTLKNYYNNDKPIFIWLDVKYRNSTTYKRFDFLCYPNGDLIRLDPKLSKVQLDNEGTAEVNPHPKPYDGVIPYSIKLDHINMDVNDNIRNNSFSTYILRLHDDNPQKTINDIGKYLAFVDFRYETTDFVQLIEKIPNLQIRRSEYRIPKVYGPNRKSIKYMVKQAIKTNLTSDYYAGVGEIWTPFNTRVDFQNDIANYGVDSVLGKLIKLEGLDLDFIHEDIFKCALNVIYAVKDGKLYVIGDNKYGYLYGGKDGSAYNFTDTSKFNMIPKINNNKDYKLTINLLSHLKSNYGSDTYYWSDYKFTMFDQENNEIIDYYKNLIEENGFSLDGLRAINIYVRHPLCESSSFAVKSSDDEIISFPVRFFGTYCETRHGWLSMAEQDQIIDFLSTQHKKTESELRAYDDEFLFKFLNLNRIYRFSNIPKDNLYYAIFYTEINNNVERYIIGKSSMIKNDRFNTKGWINSLIKKYGELSNTKFKGFLFDDHIDGLIPSFNIVKALNYSESHYVFMQKNPNIEPIEVYPEYIRKTRTCSGYSKVNDANPNTAIFTTPNNFRGRGFIFGEDYYKSEVVDMVGKLQISDFYEFNPIKFFIPSKTFFQGIVSKDNKLWDIGPGDFDIMQLRLHYSGAKNKYFTNSKLEANFEIGKTGRFHKLDLYYCKDKHKKFEYTIAKVNRICEFGYGYNYIGLNINIPELDYYKPLPVLFGTSMKHNEEIPKLIVKTNYFKKGFKVFKDSLGRKRLTVINTVTGFYYIIHSANGEDNIDDVFSYVKDNHSYKNIQKYGALFRLHMYEDKYPETRRIDYNKCRFIFLDIDDTHFVLLILDSNGHIWKLGNSQETGISGTLEPYSVDPDDQFRPYCYAERSLVDQPPIPNKLDSSYGKMLSPKRFFKVPQHPETAAQSLSWYYKTNKDINNSFCSKNSYLKYKHSVSPKYWPMNGLFALRPYLGKYINRIRVKFMGEENGKRQYRVFAICRYLGKNLYAYHTGKIDDTTTLLKWELYDIDNDEKDIPFVKINENDKYNIKHANVLEITNANEDYSNWKDNKILRSNDKFININNYDHYFGTLQLNIHRDKLVFKNGYKAFLPVKSYEYFNLKPTIISPKQNGYHNFYDENTNKTETNVFLNPYCDILENNMLNDKNNHKTKSLKIRKTKHFVSDIENRNIVNFGLNENFYKEVYSKLIDNIALENGDYTGITIDHNGFILFTNNKVKFFGVNWKIPLNNENSQAEDYKFSSFGNLDNDVHACHPVTSLSNLTPTLSYNGEEIKINSGNEIIDVVYKNGITFILFKTSGGDIKLIASSPYVISNKKNNSFDYKYYNTKWNSEKDTKLISVNAVNTYDMEHNNEFNVITHLNKDIKYKARKLPTYTYSLIDVFSLNGFDINISIADFINTHSYDKFKIDHIYNGELGDHFNNWLDLTSFVNIPNDVIKIDVEFETDRISFRFATLQENLYSYGNPSNIKIISAPMIRIGQLLDNTVNIFKDLTDNEKEDMFKYLTFYKELIKIFEKKEQSTPLSIDGYIGV